MSKIIGLSKKVILVVLLLELGIMTLPTASASAAGLADETPPPAARTVDNARLEEAYARLNEWYTHQSTWMGKADANVTRIQNLIEKATARGLDVSAVQAALDAFTAVLPGAKAYNQQAAAILASHAGFDESGMVTDPEQAMETLRSLQSALKAAYDTMGGEAHAGRLLLETIKAFVEAFRPSPTPAP